MQGYCFEIGYVLKNQQSISKNKMLKFSSHHHQTVTSNYSPVLNFSLDFLQINDFQLIFYILNSIKTVEIFRATRIKLRLSGARSFRH